MKALNHSTLFFVFNFSVSFRKKLQATDCRNATAADSLDNVMVKYYKINPLVPLKIRRCTQRKKLVPIVIALASS